MNVFVCSRQINGLQIQWTERSLDRSAPFHITTIVHNTFFGFISNVSERAVHAQNANNKIGLFKHDRQATASSDINAFLYRTQVNKLYLLMCKTIILGSTKPVFNQFLVHLKPQSNVKGHLKWYYTYSADSKQIAFSFRTKREWNAPHTHHLHRVCEKKAENCIRWVFSVDCMDFGMCIHFVCSRCMIFVCMLGVACAPKLR